MTSEKADNARQKLIEAGGITSQDLGLGRIVGQMLVYLYLSEKECSLDQIAHDLGLSKAAVSIAARQLENLGLVKRVLVRGDRKNYYRTAENIATAIQQGLLGFVQQKFQNVSQELDQVHDVLKSEAKLPGADHETRFLYERVTRAKELQDRAGKVLKSPLLHLFVKKS